MRRQTALRSLQLRPYRGTTADHHGFMFELRVAQKLHGSVKRIHVQMGNAANLVHQAQTFTSAISIAIVHLRRVCISPDFAPALPNALPTPRMASKTT
jgi:hypothetical protein